MYDRKPEALTKALLLLKKVTSPEETMFSKEDWQMLQVARFLVSKEKFIKRDADNVTLYYGSPSSVYYIDDLSQELYTLAQYIYDNDPDLVIDKTKSVDYGIPIGVKYSRLSRPTFDEAVIIINMLRNAIAHGNAYIDFERSLLHVNNYMPMETDPSQTKFSMLVDLPISMLSRLDIANIMEKNKNRFKESVFQAIASKHYYTEEDRVFLILNHNNTKIKVGLTPAEYMTLYSQYDAQKNDDKKFDRCVNINNKYDFRHLTLCKDYVGGKYIAKNTSTFDLKLQKDTKDLESMIELINNKPEIVLDSKFVAKFLELVENDDIPHYVASEAMNIFTKTMDRLNFQGNTEKSVDSISSILGIRDEEKSLDFIALYNYMTLLFSNYPLKEGNALLTEFIDLSTLSVDKANTRDLDITNFYRDVEKIIKRHLNKYNSNLEQYQYQMPCLTEYLKCITEILKKLKIRNNAYIRHIRNSLEHSEISLSGQIVELRDYIPKGDTIDKTFRSNITMAKLLELSAAYTYIYEIATYKDYQTFIQGDNNSFLSFSFYDMFRELGKEIDITLLEQFIDMLNDLSMTGLGKSFDKDEQVVDLVEELSYSISETRKKSKGSKK